MKKIGCNKYLSMLTTILYKEKLINNFEFSFFSHHFYINTDFFSNIPLMSIYFLLLTYFPLLNDSIPQIIVPFILDIKQRS